MSTALFSNRQNVDGLIFRPPKCQRPYFLTAKMSTALFSDRQNVDGLIFRPPKCRRPYFPTAKMLTALFSDRQNVDFQIGGIKLSTSLFAN
jgi:hypothetical protein